MAHTLNHGSHYIRASGTRQRSQFTERVFNTPQTFALVMLDRNQEGVFVLAARAILEKALFWRNFPPLVGKSPRATARVSTALRIHSRPYNDYRSLLVLYHLEAA